MNALNVEVSYFKNCADSANPMTVNLRTFLQSDKHRTAVERVRAIEDKKERDKMKVATLPGITPSGVFSYRDEAHLIKHSGLIAGDIDFKDNQYKPETIKRQIAKLQNVAYCGLSASGRGLWFLVPIAYPDYHKEQFTALVADFARLGIVLDTAPANVASFRFYSFDPDAYFNPDAVPYTKLHAQQPDTYTPSSRAQVAGTDGERVEAIVRQIEARRDDITSNYAVWFSLLASLATLGEGGRDFAHRISQFYPTYSSSETDKKFTHCLRMKSNRFTLGTFFKFAGDNGFTFRFAPDAKPKRPEQPRTAQNATSVQIQAPRREPITTAYNAPRNTQPTAPALPPGYERRTFTSKITGEPIELLLTADGYPAAWSDTRPAEKAIAENIRDQEILLCESSGWTFEGYKPLTREDIEAWHRMMRRSGLVK